MKKTASLIAAAVFAFTALSPQFTVIAEETSGYDMNVTVDLNGKKTPISPYIYGINEAGNSDSVRNVKTNALRQGGNRYSGYNWETNWSNAGADWHHSNDTNIGDIKDGPASAVQKLSKIAAANSVPYKLATLQMAGYAAADKDGTVTEAEIAPSSRWVEVKSVKDGELSLEPDLTDNTVYMDEYVNYLINKLGDSQSETGIQGYSLDNEPVLWNDTHPLMHPNEVSSKELISKSVELAKAVKELDPNAEIFGPAFWGMLPCINGSDSDGYEDPDWNAVKSNYRWYIEYYLDQMAKAEKENGKRLLDVIDVHYYSEDCATNEAILQGARSLYDPTYVENSWLQPWCGQYFPFLANLKESVDKYYPGTKIAISEYDITCPGKTKTEEINPAVSALSEAEALGAFAMNEVYFATYWGNLAENPYILSAINLYTNYDGKGSAFGDTLVESSTESLDKAAVFSSINSEDKTKVTMVLSNKDMTKTENAHITLEGTDVDYKSAVVYAITPDHSDIRVINVNNSVNGNTVDVELPPLSVAQIVISDKESDEKVYEAPDITEKTVEFIYDDLEDSVNGYKMIPLGDLKHLSKIVVNTTVNCTSNSEWYGGGGALTFNQLIDEDGTSFWGAKSFGYNMGTADTTITFDGYFTNGDSEEVKATVGDTYSELQHWWTSSTNDETGADVTVKFNKITLYYVYDNSEQVDKTPNYGDANCNGKVEISDVVLIMQAITNNDEFGVGGTNKYALTPEGKINADCYQPGTDITSADAFAVQKKLAGLITLPEM